MNLVSESLKELQTAWENAEKLIKSLGCPVPVCYDIPKVECQMVWDKLGDNWRICVTYGDELRPIVDCPTQIRINYVIYFEQFYEKVVNSRSEAANKALEAAYKLQAILSHY